MCKTTTARNRSAQALKSTSTKTTMKQSPTKSSAASRLFKLNWTSRPKRFLPHGLLGAVSLVFGIYLTICSLCGYLTPYQHIDGAYMFPSWSFMCYFYCMMLSGVAGVCMAPYAQSHLRFLFRFLGLELCCLSYFALRLLPTFANNFGRTLLVRFLDKSLSSGMLLLIFYGMYSITRLAVKENKVPLIQAVASYPAFVSLLTLTPFPLHLGWDGGQDWYDCAHAEFPILGFTTAAYAFVPATVMFSLVAFCASLYLRKIIATRGMIISFGSVLLALVVTVLSMEYHVPFVSVQRFYLPCPMEAGDEAWVKMLDVSPMTQAALKYMGFEIKAPEGIL